MHISHIGHLQWKGEVEVLKDRVTLKKIKGIVVNDDFAMAVTQKRK